MLKIKNISSAEVTIALPDLRLRREIKPGMAMPFKDEEYEYLTFDPGFNALIDGHYIRIIGAPAGQEPVEQEAVFEAADIKNMLQKRDITAFAKFLPKATSAEKEAAIKYAVEYRITDSAFAALIKSHCGVNIIEAIHQASED